MHVPPTWNWEFFIDFSNFCTFGVKPQVWFVGQYWRTVLAPVCVVDVTLNAFSLLLPFTYFSPVTHIQQPCSYISFLCCKFQEMNTSLHQIMFCCRADAEENMSAPCSWQMFPSLYSVPHIDCCTSWISHYFVYNAILVPNVLCKLYT
jgi:hypothetical protein